MIPGSPEPHSNPHPEVIVQFEKQNNIYVTNWSHRFPVCDLPCRPQHGVEIHFNTKHRKEDKTQEKYAYQKFLGTLEDEKSSGEEVGGITNTQISGVL